MPRRFIYVTIGLASAAAFLLGLVVSNTLVPAAAPIRTVVARPPLDATRAASPGPSTRGSRRGRCAQLSTRSARMLCWSWVGFQPARSCQDGDLAVREVIRIFVDQVAHSPPQPAVPTEHRRIVQILAVIHIALGPHVFTEFLQNLIFGGPCEFNNDGDGLVLYDPLASRWVFTQHVFSQKQCIAISQTSDPTGSYFLYEFDTPGNDDPKLGLWSDAVCCRHL